MEPPLYRRWFTRQNDMKPPKGSKRKGKASISVLAPTMQQQAKGKEKKAYNYATTIYRYYLLNIISTYMIYYYNINNYYFHIRLSMSILHLV